MKNSQKEIAMLAGNGDRKNSHAKYIGIGRFLVRYSTLILDVLLLATAMFDGFMLGVHYG